MDRPLVTVKHILFDCDGTLVDSEGIAFRECTAVINEILRSKRIDDQVTQAELEDWFIGCSFFHIVACLSKTKGFEVTIQEMEELAELEGTRVRSALSQEVKHCPYVQDVVAELTTRGHILSVVSSSALPRIRVCLETTGLTRYFANDNVFSSVTSLAAPESKPSPAVYRHALRQLGIPSGEAVAVEDSVNGVTAAVGAGLKVIGYTGAVHALEQKRLVAETLRIAGAVVVIDDFRRLLELIRLSSERNRPSGLNS